MTTYYYFILICCPEKDNSSLLHFSLLFCLIDYFSVQNERCPWLLFPAFTNFEVFLFFFFQVDIILKFFDVAFLHSFFARGHTSSTVWILYNLIQNVHFFSNNIYNFSNLQQLAYLLKKSISIDISFDSKFLLNFPVSAPYRYVTIRFTIELCIYNLYFLDIWLFHSSPYSIAVFFSTFINHARYLI